MARYTFVDAEMSIRGVMPKFKAVKERAAPLAAEGKLPIKTLALLSIGEHMAEKIAADAQDADALPEFAAEDMYGKIVQGAELLGRLLHTACDEIMLAEIPEDTLPC